jgi:ribosomal-protein-serine acetyltransferase
VTAQPDFVLHAGYALRELDEADAAELHALIERNRPRLAMWMHWAQRQTVRDTAAFIDRAAEKERQRRAFHRCIVAGGGIVGVVGFSTIDELNRAGAIGYWLDSRHEGQGVMTAAVAALADHAFEHLQLNRVEIRADVQNEASRAIAERLGFQLEGVARQAYRVVGDRYSDDAVYSMLAGDRARAQLMRARGGDLPVAPSPRR